MKLDSDQNQTLLTFISENWEQFVAHVASHNGLTGGIDADSDAEDLADAISEALEEAVMYD